VDPVSKVIRGVPVTVTDSEKFTCTEMEPPTLYDPSAVDADTDDTVGAVVSMTNIRVDDVCVSVAPSRYVVATACTT